MKSLFYLLLSISPWVSAQDLKWNEGSIVLTSGTVVTGKISMAPGHNLVLFKKSEISRKGETTIRSDEDRIENPPTGIVALPAYKLNAVYFYDEEANINRRFVALGERRTFPGTLLYEAVVQGRIDVLRRPRTLATTGTTPKDYDYYCHDHHTLVPLWRFYRDVYPTMEEASRQHLAAFIKANNLKKGDDANLITIIGYYNKMVRSEETLARY